MPTNQSTRYEERTELTGDAPTLVEGLPGLGMVASIAVDQITTQLELEQHGRIVSDDPPPVASFSDGRVRRDVEDAFERHAVDWDGRASMRIRSHV